MVQLNKAVSLQATSASVSVVLVDAGGNSVVALAGEFADLFGSEWFHLSVEVDPARREIRVGEAEEVLEAKTRQLRLKPRTVSATLVGDSFPLLRSILFMDEGITIGADVGAGTPQTIYSGFMREVLLKHGSKAVLNLQFLKAPGTQDISQGRSNTAGSHFVILFQKSLGWAVRPNRLPALPRGWDAYQQSQAVNGTFVSTHVPVLNKVPAGIGNWDGPACDRCAPGYRGGSCQITMCVANWECSKARCPDGVNCEGGIPSGYCDLVKTSASYGECVCAPGYAGFFCTRCQPEPVRILSSTFRGQPVVICTDENLCPKTCQEGGRWRRNEYFPTLLSTGGPVAKCGAGHCSPDYATLSKDVCGCPLSRNVTCMEKSASADQCCAATSRSPSRKLYDCRGFPSQYTSCRNPDSCGAKAATIACTPGTGARVHATPACKTMAAMMCANGNRLSDAAILAKTYTFEKNPVPAKTMFDAFAKCPSGICSLETQMGRCLPCTTETREVNPVDCHYKKPGSAYNNANVLHDIHHYKLKVKEDFCGCASPKLPVCSTDTVISTTNDDGSVKSTFETERITCLRENGQPVCLDWATVLGSKLKIDCGGFPLPELETVACSTTGRDPCGCPLPLFECIAGTEGVCDPADCPVWGDPIVVDCGGTFPPVADRVAPHPCGCKPPPTPECLPGTEHKLCPDVAYVDYEEADCQGRPSERASWEPGMDRQLYLKACTCPYTVAPHRTCLPGTQCPSEPCAAGTQKGPGGQYYQQACPEPVYTEVDCVNSELVSPDVGACECPPRRQSRCKGSVSCFGKGRLCYPYVCGSDRHRPAEPGDACKLSCTSNEHCADNHICVGNACVPSGTPAELTGCAADPSACLPYVCSDATNTCYDACVTGEQCAGGRTCAFDVVTVADGHHQTEQLRGTCVTTVSLGAACSSQEVGGPCGGYACGEDNQQTSFRASVCRTSCAFNAHCDRAHSCVGNVCVAGRPAARPGCASQPRSYCAPYACGAEAGVAPKGEAVCRVTCMKDLHCAPLYVCRCGECVAGPILRNGVQDVTTIDKRCFNEDGKPLRCLEVPLSSNISTGVVAYVMPFETSDPLPPPADLECTAATASLCQYASPTHTHTLPRFSFSFSLYTNTARTHAATTTPAATFSATTQRSVPTATTAPLRSAARPNARWAPSVLSTLSAPPASASKACAATRSAPASASTACASASAGGTTRAPTAAVPAARARRVSPARRRQAPSCAARRQRGRSAATARAVRQAPARATPPTRAATGATPVARRARSAGRAAGAASGSRRCGPRRLGAWATTCSRTRSSWCRS